MNDLATRAELEKLARTLNTEVEQVAFLGDLGPAQLRTLREDIAEALFEKFRTSFTGLARLSSILPPRIGAKIAERVLGPILSARVAAEMAPAKAIELSARLSDTFLADTCLQLDPEHAKPIIVGFPIERSVAITRLLLRRGEYITMGRFVDVLPSATLFAATDAIEDGADLLRISFFVEDSHQLERVINHLDEARCDAVLAAAATEALWPEVVATLRRIGPEPRLRLTTMALAQDQATLDSLIRSAAEHDLWPALLELGRELPDAAVERLSRRTIFDDAMIVRSVIDSVMVNGLWSALHAQLAVMGALRCTRLLEIAASERPTFLAELGTRITQDDACADTLKAGAARLPNGLRADAVAASGNSTLAALLADSS